MKAKDAIPPEIQQPQSERLSGLGRQHLNWGALSPAESPESAACSGYTLGYYVSCSACTRDVCSGEHRNG